MNIKLHYGDRPFVFPDLTEEQLHSMDAETVKLLVLLAKDCSTVPQGAEKAFEGLQKLGILSFENKEYHAIKHQDMENSESQNKEKDAKSKRRTQIMETLVYTDDEFEAVLDGRADLQNLITEAQNALGKPLYQADSKLLVSIAEGYDFDEDYMLTLLAYCNRIGKRNMRYVEKTATSLYDLGIKTAAELLTHLNTQEEAYHFEKSVRRIFGLGTRAFTTKEKVFLKAWQETYQIEEALLQKAYDITVAATAKPSLNYANSILERWYAEGIRSATDLENAEKEKAPVKKAGFNATSYNTDDFFTAALDRSYGDKPKKEK